jgi:hypothetical protein
LRIILDFLSKLLLLRFVTRKIATYCYPFSKKEPALPFFSFLSKRSLDIIDFGGGKRPLEDFLTGNS